ncbi:hypothetical protein CBL_04165 [Carabus blaptoides fortunei]
MIHEVKKSIIRSIGGKEYDDVQFYKEMEQDDRETNSWCAAVLRASVCGTGDATVPLQEWNRVSCKRVKGGMGLGASQYSMWRSCVDFSTAENIQERLKTYKLQLAVCAGRREGQSDVLSVIRQIPATNLH